MKTFFNLYFVPSIFSLLIIVTVCGSTGCSSSSSGTPPLPVTVTGITATDTSITFTWTDPKGGNLTHVAATASNGSAEDITAGTGAWNVTGLTASTDYTFTFTSVYASGNNSSVKTFHFSTTSGDAASAILITTAEDLNDIRNDLAGHYLLMNDISLSGYASGEGWNPVGPDVSNNFTGSFNGQGFVISDLTINRAAVNDQGLFGHNGGTLTGIAMENVSVSGKISVGGLAGCNTGTITNSYATGTVTGSSDYAGGLVGYSTGSITDSYATASVAGVKSTGGLVGYNFNGSVTGCYATGTVTGSEYYTGGLAGYSRSGTITDSYATGTVTGTGNNTGGLVGFESSGTITRSYATGTVTGSSDCTGGLVGRHSGTITGSYATGDVTGNTSGTGGLVGYNWATVENSYARGAVTAPSHCAGLIGYNSSSGGTATGSYATGAVNCSSMAGGLAGYNGGDVSADSFWDTTTTGKDTTGDDEGTGMVTADMKDSSNYTGWDFTTVWNIDATGVINDGYPYLRDNLPVQ